MEAKNHKHTEHAHEHGGIFGKNTELYFSLLCGILLGVGFGLSFADVPSWVTVSLYIVAYFFGGFFTAKEAVQTIAKGGFEIDFLMLIAAIVPVYLANGQKARCCFFFSALGTPWSIMPWDAHVNPLKRLPASRHLSLWCAGTVRKWRYLSRNLRLGM